MNTVEPRSPAAPQHFELVVQPPQPGRPWHATLVARPAGEPAEFDSPLALLRHLLRLTLPDTPTGGLR